MRKIRLILTILLVISILQSCEFIRRSDTETPAEFPGGHVGLVSYLQRNIRVPAIAEELGIKGKVYAKFVVDHNGNVSNIRIIKGIDDCPECSEEVLRVVSTMPKWKPAMSRKGTLNQWFTLPVVFNVQ